MIREILPGNADTLRIRLQPKQGDGEFGLGLAAGALTVLAGPAGMACRIEYCGEPGLILVFTTA